MSDNDASGTVQVYTAKQESFLDDGKALGLKSLKLELKRHSSDAVQALVKLLTDKDSEPKIRLQAATALLELQVKVADKISSDQIARLIAEVKLNPTGSKRLTTDDEDSTPLVDFGTVQKVS